MSKINLKTVEQFLNEKELKNVLGGGCSCSKCDVAYACSSGNGTVGKCNTKTCNCDYVAG